MERRKVLRVVKAVFWPLLSLGLLLVFVVVPICKAGLWKYASDQMEINPFIAMVMNKYTYHQAKQLSEEWYNRIETIRGGQIPEVEWVEDTVTFKGINSLWCLDQQADDVRPLLMKEWNLPYDKTLWWNCHYTGECPFNPAVAAQPIYNMEKNDSTLHIKTGTKYDTWVWLVGKEKQPKTYCVEFDFITHTKSQETLQICFASNSLASRFRFNLENNETLKFDNVDHGYFLYWSRVDLWSNLRKPCSIPLHKRVHVKFVCINNVFAVYYDNDLKMAIRIKDYEAQLNYWYLIFWNGTPNNEFKGTQDNYMDFEISNLKIYHEATK